MDSEKESAKRGPLISHNHRKRSLLTWVVPLVVIIVVMVLLPKVVGMLGG